MTEKSTVHLTMGEDDQGKPVFMIPEDSRPLGMLHAQQMNIAAAGTTTGTTTTVSVTWGPDADTDPADSDSD